MEDFSETFDGVMRSTRKVLEEANGPLTEGNLQQLNSVTEAKETLQSMGQDKLTAVADIRETREVVENTCKIVAFGFYMVMISLQAVLPNMVKNIDKDMENPESTKLPKVIRIKIDEAKHYLKKAGEVMEVVDKKITEIMLKVKQAQEKEFDITDKERRALKMDTLYLECELDKCKGYLDDANGVIQILSSDIDKEVAKYSDAAKRKSDATNIVGSGISDAMWKVFTRAKTPDGKVLAGLLAIGSSLATLYLQKRISDDNVTYSDSLRLKFEELNSEMRKAKSEYERGKKSLKWEEKAIDQLSPESLGPEGAL